ncbi:hypothetical protein [Burkholderia cenocepacia]|uniref:hypothetical protein n=1 Tax=Burkholderia cenocepacia TaxID=95486 RepID=UPI000762089B|nr:hypothetical protein [Burkholderia cenocepacia]KWU23401.1 hypothetical protein AS149_37060 [Burkholderia cenocepacia]
MDWMTVLEGAASIELFPRSRSLADVLHESRKQTSARARKDNISEEEALNRVNNEYRLGQFLTFIVCILGLVATLACTTAVSDILGFVISLSFPVGLFGPKVAFHLLQGCAAAARVHS